jgi:hypothetical protein
MVGVVVKHLIPAATQQTVTAMLALVEMVEIIQAVAAGMAEVTTVLVDLE